MRKTTYLILCCCIICFSSCERVRYVTEVSTEVSYSETIIEKPVGVDDYRVIDVPCIRQYPQLPTGCESTAAAMVLQYYGENITHSRFAELWLPKSSDFYNYNGKYYGPDPNHTFAGDPFSEYAYGCYAPVITSAINSNSNLCTAETLYNLTLVELCRRYIDNNKPVLIWATVGMTESLQGKSWYTPNGELFTWISGEHCLVLVGYDDNYYYFNDPLYGNAVGYKREVAEKRYSELGMQAVYIDLSL